MTSGSSLKLYLNSLVYHRNIFGSSSEVFGNLRKCSDIFGNFRKYSENVRERSPGCRNNFGKSSEIFGKSSKTPSSACLYNKKNITRRLEDIYVIYRAGGPYGKKLCPRSWVRPEAEVGKEIGIKDKAYVASRVLKKHQKTTPKKMWACFSDWLYFDTWAHRYTKRASK